MKPVIKNDFLKDLDLLPVREHMLEKVRLTAKRIGSFYGFHKISTSIVEEYKRIAPLAREGFLDAVPPVAIKTRSGSEFALRPSGVVGVLRAYGDYGMSELPHPVKLNFEGESFFCGREDAVLGKYEMGFVMIGEAGPIAEAELFQVMRKTLEELGMRQEEVSLRLNAIGCQACRTSFRTSLTSFLRSRVNRFCKNCKRDFKRAQVRILVCKEEKCSAAVRHAPQVLDYLCELCKKHLRGVLEFLDEMGMPYLLDHTFFNEGSLYTQLVFQLTYTAREKPKDTIPPAVEGSPSEAVKEADASSAPLPIFIIAEGGRVTPVAELITGRRTDAAAAVFLLNTMEEMFVLRQSSLNIVIPPKIFLVQLGDLAKRKSIAVIEMLRAANIEVAEILGRDSIKTQLKTAEKMDARLALILGQKEALDETVIVREVDSGLQETIPQEKLVEFLRRKLS